LVCKPPSTPLDPEQTGQDRECLTEQNPSNIEYLNVLYPDRQKQNSAYKPDPKPDYWSESIHNKRNNQYHNCKNDKKMHFYRRPEEIFYKSNLLLKYIIKYRKFRPLIGAVCIRPWTFDLVLFPPQNANIASQSVRSS
jgi:hypothetical protein